MQKKIYDCHDYYTRWPIFMKKNINCCVNKKFNFIEHDQI